MIRLRINREKLFLIQRERIATFFLFAGMLLVYMGSLHPWFLWPLGELYVMPAAMSIVLAILMDKTISKPIFTRTEYIPPLLGYTALLYYQLLVNSANINGYIVQTFTIVVFYALFRMSLPKLHALVTFLCKVMALLLSVSMPFYFLHMFGFPLPSVNAVYGEDALYSYTNYFFFLEDDRSLIFIISRFPSVFLEPGHLGTATVLLLLSQIGKWKRWYNIVLIIATFVTFSLAAYVLFVVIIVLASWVQRKQIMRKLLAFAILLSAVVGGSFVYNEGDNLVNRLILARLEVDDGEMAGDNRVSDDFKTEYESFMQSSDILFGREMDKTTFGNSGYRVYIYENGIVGLILVIVFYGLAAARFKDWRSLVAAAVIATLCFIVRGYPLWFNVFIPLLATVYLPPPTNKKETTNESIIYS